MYLAGMCCDDCEPRGYGLGLVLPWNDESIDTSSIPTTGDLGSQAVQMISMLSAAVPVAGPFISAALQFADNLEETLHIGAGRNEADVIVHDSNSGQNLLMEKLGMVTDAFLVGKNPPLEQLRQMWLSVYTMGEIFKRFVLSGQFVDRRASGQALNTVMPYIDGTCGYSVPLGNQATYSETNCISWGDGTLGGAGTSGMLGALGRAIVARGGAIPVPSPQQGAGTSIPTLNYPWPGIPGIPQSGTITPRYGSYPQNRANVIPIDTGGMSQNTMIALLAAVGVGLVAMRSRGSR